MEHVLMDHKTCSFCKSDTDTRSCPICDGGLGLCLICGKAEIELSEPCISMDLVRAAPDLLAACESVVAAFGTTKFRLTPEEGTCLAAVCEAAAAIKKAKGEL